MTCLPARTTDNLRIRKLQLEQDLNQASGKEQRDWIDAELTKIEIALTFLDDVASPPSIIRLPAKPTDKYLHAVRLGRRHGRGCDLGHARPASCV